jgi:hypothetical protein
VKIPTPLLWTILIVLSMLTFTACYPVVAVITYWATHGTADTPVEIRMEMFGLVKFLFGAVVGALTTLIAMAFGRKDDATNPP